MPGQLTQLVSQAETPHGQAKLTLEGLEHWRGRLTQELARLVADIEATEAMADRWCGKCAETLHELRALHDTKQKDLEAVLKAISDIQHDLGAATMVASQPSASPLLLIPRRVGHPSTNALLQSAKSPPSTLFAVKSPERRNTAEISRNISRQSAILVNSPDLVSKKLLFT